MSDDERPSMPGVRSELVERVAREQELRRRLAGVADDERERIWAEIRPVDEANIAWLVPLLEQCGWLGTDLVGTDGAHATWLLMQHAPPPIQKRWLPDLDRAVAADHAPPVHAAYLADRVAMHERRPQSHGTQWTGVTRDRLRLWTLDDPAGVNDRRAALGLRSLDAQDIADAWPMIEIERDDSG